MSFWEFVLKFAGQNPFTFLIIICATYYGWKCPWIVIKRAIRSRDIQKHGWPSAKHMDADGDLVYPDENKAA